MGNMNNMNSILPRMNTHHHHHQHHHSSSPRTTTPISNFNDALEEVGRLRGICRESGEYIEELERVNESLRGERFERRGRGRTRTTRPSGEEEGSMSPVSVSTRGTVSPMLLPGGVIGGDGMSAGTHSRFWPG